MSREKQDRSFRAACVQFDVRRGEVAHNLAEAERGLREAAANDVQLVVLPEMWTTSFVPQPSDALLDASAKAEQRVIELSRELDLTVIGSGPEAESDRLFNRAMLVEEGRVLGSYRKMHLFSPNAEHRFHTPGNEPLVVDSKLGRLGVVVCYDIRFPELIRYYFYERVEVLAVPGQWPEARADHWRILLKARAIENEVFVIGCNRTGIEDSLKNDDHLHFPGNSRIVDPMGTVLVAGAGESGSLSAEIDLKAVRMMRRILPVSKDRRPDVYSKIWTRAWSQAVTKD